MLIFFLYNLFVLCYFVVLIGAVVIYVANIDKNNLQTRFYLVYFIFFQCVLKDYFYLINYFVLVVISGVCRVNFGL